MKLFVWTENEYEACNHKLVFADTVEQARDMIVAIIRNYWDTCAKNEWTADHCENEVQEFLTDTKWQVTEYEIKPGMLPL